MTDPCGLHELRPVPVPDRRVLGAVVRVPGARLLVQHAQLLGELLALLVHRLDVELAPWRALPVVERGVDDGGMVPDVLNRDH